MCREHLNNQLARALRSTHWGKIFKFKHEWELAGKASPPLKAPKGDEQLGVVDFFKPSNWTADKKKAAEGKAAKAHAERVAGDRAAQAEWNAATFGLQ